MRAAFADISVALVPLDFMYGPNMTPKKIKNNLYFILKLKRFFYHIASIIDMQINIKELADVNQDGPSLIIEASPNPPPPPQAPK